MRFVKDNREDSPAWKWAELDYIRDPERKAQVDALKLFAAFLKDTDNKALQNRLLCRSEVDVAGICRDPILYIHDLGNTLGTTRNYLLLYVNHALDLTAWKAARVRRRAAACWPGG